MPTLQQTADTIRTQISAFGADATETLVKVADTTRARLLDANRAVAAGRDKVAAQLPSWLPTAPVSHTDVTKAVKQVFDLQQNAIATNKAFVLDLVDIWATPSTASPSAASPSTAKKAKPANRTANRAAKRSSAK